MFGRGVPLFRLFGFSVKADWSWLLIFVLITWSLAAGVFPSYYPGLAPQTHFWMGLAGALGLFASIVLHELGHSLVARRYGVEMRGITLFVFGGVAEMNDEPPSPAAEIGIAIAGPIVSIFLAGACLGAGIVTQAFGWPNAVRGVLLYLGWLNLLLVAFNLVPAFPLDGGRVLRGILWSYKGSVRWATRITSRLGSAFGILLVILGVASFLGGNFISGLWWFLLGMFLRAAAQMSYQQVLMRRALEGEPIRRFMQPEVQTVPPGVTLQEFVDEYVYRYHHKMFPVTGNGDGLLQGCMTTRKLQEVPREEWPTHRVAEVAEPCGEANTVREDTDAMAALSKMSETGQSRLMVVDGGHLRGMVSLKDMMKFIAFKVELEGS